MTAATTPVEFDFTALGWLQFEQLCTRVLATAGVDGAEWQGDADDTRWVWVGSGRSVRSLLGGAAATVLSDTFPVGVCLLWVPPRVDSIGAAEARIRHALTGLHGEELQQLVVITNFRANETLNRLVTKALPRHLRLWVVGRDELSALIERHPELWLELPFVLGVRRSGEDDAGSARAEGSSLDLAAARALAPTFVVTEAYRECCRVVQQNGFTVLTGPPEVGKTAIARMIAYVQMCKGWEAHECTDPRQFWDAYRADAAQVFVADDAFGSTEYSPAAAERWAVELDRILHRADKRHWLLWTSRPTPLAASLRRIHREHGVERFPQTSQVTVNAAALSAEERVLMLFRHALAAEATARDRRVLRMWGVTIVEDPHLTPERIRRFVTEHLPHVDPDLAGIEWIRSAIVAEIAEPTEAMRASLEALDDDHRALLVALLDPLRRRSVSVSSRPRSAATPRGWRGRCPSSSTGSRITFCESCRPVPSRGCTPAGGIW